MEGFLFFCALFDLTEEIGSVVIGWILQLPNNQYFALIETESNGSLTVEEMIAKKGFGIINVLRRQRIGCLLNGQVLDGPQGKDG